MADGQSVANRSARKRSRVQFAPSPSDSLETCPSGRRGRAVTPLEPCSRRRFDSSRLHIGQVAKLAARARSRVWCPQGRRSSSLLLASSMHSSESMSASRRTWTKELLGPLVADSISVYEVIRKADKRLSGGLSGLVAKRIKEYGIDTSHFRGQGHARGGCGKLPWQMVLTKTDRPYRTSAGRLRRALIDAGVSYACAVCNMLPTWQGRKLVFHVDHRDGDWRNNTKENLRFLCPNCHSQTENFGRKPKSSILARMA